MPVNEKERGRVFRLFLQKKRVFRLLIPGAFITSCTVFLISDY
jgi:hypothetical protein